MDNRAWVFIASERTKQPQGKPSAQYWAALGTILGCVMTLGAAKRGTARRQAAAASARARGTV